MDVQDARLQGVHEVIQRISFTQLLLKLQWL